MPEEGWIGRNKPLTSNQLPTTLEDVIKAEGKTITTSTDVRGSGNSQIDRINAELAKPNLSDPARAALEKKKSELERQQSHSSGPSFHHGAGGRTNGSVGISFEDTQALLQQLQRFQETIGGDWKSVLSQWQNLQSCWQDRQYDRFEPFFEQLCRTYDQCEQQCEEHTQFLEERIRGSQDPQEKFESSSIQNTGGLAAIGLATKDPVMATLGLTSLLGFLNSYGGGHGSKYHKARQLFLRSLLDDPKTPKNVKGWFKQEQNRKWNQQKAKALGKRAPGGGKQMRGFPGYDVQHTFPKIDMSSTFTHGLASINRAKPQIAKKLDLPPSYY